LNKVVFPVVVKPVDASGNRGMSYCNNKEELIEACKYARTISSNPTIIVEKELKGPEFAAHYVVAEGEARLLWFGSEHHQPGQKNNLYSLVYTTSAHLKQYLEEVNDKIIAAFREIGCKDGIAWIECIRDNDGHFYCFEMGYRFGATMIYTQYEKVSGFNSIRWMIECAINKHHTIADLPQGLSEAHKSISASYHLFSNQEGIVDHIEGLSQIEAMPNVIIDIPKRGGNTARYHSCIGVLRIFAEDCEHLCRTISDINSALKISNAGGDNMFINFDDYTSVKEEYILGLGQMRGGYNTL
jgi:biotin carboxylase